jgi:hypothetical protein
MPQPSWFSHSAMLGKGCNSMEQSSSVEASSCSLSQSSQNYMELKGLLLCLQENATGLYPVLVKSIPHPLILPSMPGSS